MNKIFNILNWVENDVPLPWGMYFQDSKNQLALSIVELHGFLFLFLIGILTYVTYILFLLIVEKQRGYSYKYVTHHTLLEVVWTATPTLILGTIGVPSLDLLYLSDISAVEVPYEGVTIKVIGNQWYWTYDYNLDTNILALTTPNLDETNPNNSNETILPVESLEILKDQDHPGRFQYDSYLIPTSDLKEGELRLLEVDNRLEIPLNQPVKLLITSADVLHDFAVPALGVKIDCNPGRLNAITIKSSRPGLVYGQCSELCGVGHSEMPISIDVLNDKDWDTFLIYIIVSSLNEDLDDSFKSSLINL